MVVYNDIMLIVVLSAQVKQKRVKPVVLNAQVGQATEQYGYQATAVALLTNDGLRSSSKCVDW